MAVRIRLQRHGKKGKPFYKIVAADLRSKRDGRFIDMLGFYNPTTVPATIELDVDKAVYWLQNGAEPTDTVRSILQFKGALYKKHLLRGFAKGALTAEQVEEQFTAWIEKKNQVVVSAQMTEKEKKQAAYRASVEAGKERAEARVKAKMAALEAPAEEVESEEAEAAEPEAESAE